jgi:hypothetical protein
LVTTDNATRYHSPEGQNRNKDNEDSCKALKIQKMRKTNKQRRADQQRY